MLHALIRSRRRALIALAVTLLVTPTADAEPPAAEQAEWMGEAEIRAALAGAAIDGHYASGRTFTESYRADGRLTYREPARQSQGHWSVQSGAFCTIYEGDPTGGCYRVRRVGPNCFEFYFVARTEEQARQDPRDPSWTARGWVNSQPATCRDGASV
jgi:hypothetical protein